MGGIINAILSPLYALKGVLSISVSDVLRGLKWIYVLIVQ